MKVINTGNTFRIFDDSLRTYEQFPVNSYIVRFDKMTGFYLEAYTAPEINEEKIYGVHDQKVNKVLRSFEAFNRNLGVILSGNKGIGKSLFAKMLSIKALEKGYPLIVVDKFIPGIAAYLESINQEVVVLFDEFDKTFGEVKVSENQATPQSSMLSLFDGVSGGKKLFVVTCNKLESLNAYLVNRPGRFHYHFRFEYPSADEVREYLTDKLDEKYYREIDNVVAFSRKVDLNYDCLRAIAFELNTGLTFSEAIRDMNIINMSEYNRYNIKLVYEDGLTASFQNYGMDLFSDDNQDIWLSNKTGGEFVEVKFTASDAEFNSELGCYVIAPDNLEVTYEDHQSYADIVKRAKASNVKFLMFKRRYGKSIHYAV